MSAHLHVLQPAYSDAPDVAAASAFSSASTRYRVTRRHVKGHTLELHMPQLGKSIALSKKAEPLLHKVTEH